MATIKNTIAGLQIVAKYLKRKEDEFVSADHDIIYTSLSTDTEISDEDRAALYAAGWHESSDTGCWSIFV